MSHGYYKILLPIILAMEKVKITQVVSACVLPISPQFLQSLSSKVVCEHERVCVCVAMVYSVWGVMFGVWYVHVLV